MLQNLRNFSNFDFDILPFLRLHFANSVQKLDISIEDIKNIETRVLTIHGTKDRNSLLVPE